jgi:type IV pilus assembly protein PilY1
MTASSFAEAVSVLKETLVQKTATINDPITNQPTSIDFVLGDVFHSDPQVVGAPNRFRYFAEDVATDPCTPASTRYRCFFARHELRRKMLVLGANDGQLHAFDAGLPRKKVVGGKVTVELDNGTGKELFAFVPRASLPVVRQLAQGTFHSLSVDGSPVIDDVFIDPVHNALAGNPPDPGEREWRTVVLGGMREGGRAYYALDVTQPDRLDADGLADPLAGTYVPSCLGGGADCGPLPFPSVLWEFTDTADEDGNGAPDLGDTWSKPNTGRIRVLENGRPAVKFVAVFGGGLDALFKQQPVDPATGQAREPSGNFLYMVDIETGRILYKRRLDLVGGATIPASAPSEPAAVDTDQDGFLDTVYIGNTAGYLYKVDLRTEAAVDPLTRRITAPEWEPFAVFSTGSRPIYFPPSVVFVGSLGKYALAFGTGDREDLWSETTQEGRFYILLDDDFRPGNSSPVRTEANYVGISGEISVSANLAEGTNFLVSPPPGKLAGYYLRLGVKERVITRAFALAGVTVFSSYAPESRTAGDAVCAQGGESHLFVVQTANGNSVLTVGSPARASRYRVVADLVTSPYVEQSVTKNKAPATGAPAPNPCAGMESVTRSLQKLLPANCRFANYTTNLMTIRSDTGIECIAPVPVCIVEKNWKEF